MTDMKKVRARSLLRVLGLVCFMGFTSQLKAQEFYVVKSEYYHFEINYWFNMHHLLKHESFLNSDMDSTALDLILPDQASENFQTALDFYNEQFKDKNLRTDEYLSDFKVWITGKAAIPDEIPEKFAAHTAVLQAFSPIYKTYFWTRHFESCRQMLEQHLPLIRNTEKAYWTLMENKTKAFTLDEIVKVDLVFYGSANKWNPLDRPYTSIFPTRVVMATGSFMEVEGEWLELLFHESAHALILSSSGFVGGTIQDIAAIKKVEVPRQLSHAYLFYITGHIAQQLMQEQGMDYPETYMQYRKVFFRYHHALQRLDDYLEGEESLSQVTADILEELSK